MVKKFLAHGDQELQVHNRCIELKLLGAFNQEGVEACIADFYRQVETHFSDGKPWAALVDVRFYELIPEQSKATVIESYQWCESHGQAYEAVVGEMNAVQKTQYLQFIEESNTHIQFRFFSDYPSAVQWLDSMGMR